MKAQTFDFIFPDSGIRVKIRKVSPMLGSDIAKSFPEPKPPLNEVDYGEPRGKIIEPNYADPQYLLEMERYTIELGKKISRATLLRGVILEGDEWKDEAQEYRDFILEQTGEKIAEPDELVYITRVAIATQGDYDDLFRAITRRSQPTQEAIDEAKESFRG